MFFFGNKTRNLIFAIACEVCTVVLGLKEMKLLFVCLRSSLALGLTHCLFVRNPSLVMANIWMLSFQGWLWDMKCFTEHNNRALCKNPTFVAINIETVIFAGCHCSAMQTIEVINWVIIVIFIVFMKCDATPVANCKKIFKGDDSNMSFRYAAGARYRWVTSQGMWRDHISPMQASMPCGTEKTQQWYL